MVTERDSEILRRMCEVGLTAGETDGIVAALSAIAKFVDYPAGTEIFAEGEIHRRLYLLSRGAVSLDMGTASGGHQRILTVGEGDLLAWSGLLGDGHMTATATALEPVNLVEFDVDDLRKLCRNDHEVGYRVMSWIAKALSRRLLATRLQLLDLYHIEGA